YIVGWALINPKIAPPLPEEQTRVPVPQWVRSFQEAYSNNMLAGLMKALLQPANARAIEAEGARISYSTLVKNFCVALVPFLLTTLTLWGVWWYVVIHQQTSVEEAPEALQQLGTPGLATPSSTPAEAGPSTEFYIWYWIIAAIMALMLVRYYRRMDGDRF